MPHALIVVTFGIGLYRTQNLTVLPSNPLRSFEIIPEKHIYRSIMTNLFTLSFRIKTHVPLDFYFSTFELLRTLGDRFRELNSPFWDRGVPCFGMRCPQHELPWYCRIILLHHPAIFFLKAVKTYYLF